MSILHNVSKGEDGAVEPVAIARIKGTVFQVVVVAINCQNVSPEQGKNANYWYEGESYLVQKISLTTIDLVSSPGSPCACNNFTCDL